MKKIKISIQLNKKQQNNKVLAWVSLEMAGIRIPGFKVCKLLNKKTPIVYFPSKLGKFGKYYNTPTFIDKTIEEKIRKEILKKYQELIKQPKKKRKKPRVASIKLNSLFHFYKCRKDKLTVLRVWFVARYVLDVNGTGYVLLKELCRACKLSGDYLKRQCKNSALFRAVDERVYYCSVRKIFQECGLLWHRCKQRRAKLTQNWKKQFSTQAGFTAYITKSYAELDLDQYKKQTQGRISYEAMAHYFKINRKTAIRNLKRANAKAVLNVKLYKQYRFDSLTDFGVWLGQNIGTVKMDGKSMLDNPRAFYARKIVPNVYCLAKRLPNIYKYTGA